jgi:hypothetical protein
MYKLSNGTKTDCMVMPIQQQVDIIDNCQVMCNLFQDQIRLIRPLCKIFGVKDTNSWNHILATLFVGVLGKNGNASLI